MKLLGKTKGIIVMFGVLLLLLSGSSLVASGATGGMLTVEASAAFEGQPAPGLAVVYYRNSKKVRHIDAMVSETKMLERGKPGAPLKLLDHNFGFKDVFDSGRNWFVGMLIHGLVNFDKTGTYELQALSNDGIRLFINGQQLIEDPDIHSDRLSPIGKVQVYKPGWYPFKIKYFQRKGTSALRMYWKKPGQTDFSIIPAEAYGHIKK